MTDIAPRICNSCVLLRDDGNSCDAFPGGIPDVINDKLADHREPLRAQDNDVVFVMMETQVAQDAFQWWLDLRREFNITY